VNVDAIAAAMGITLNPTSNAQSTTLEGVLLNSGPVQSCVVGVPLVQPNFGASLMKMSHRIPVLNDDQAPYL
jgi:hypothetical protein